MIDCITADNALLSIYCYMSELHSLMLFYQWQLTVVFISPSPYIPPRHKIISIIIYTFNVLLYFSKHRSLIVSFNIMCIENNLPQSINKPYNHSFTQSISCNI